MLLNNRIIYSDNGVLSDFSQPLSDYRSSTQVIVVTAAQDAIYIGSDMPFNHRWFDVSVVNSNASIASAWIWDGRREWKQCVDVIDQTSVGGKTLAQSGIISWVPNKDDNWSRSNTNYKNEIITGLSGVVIYDLYWAKLTFSGDFSAGTAFNYVGHKFSSDSQLGTRYPELLRSNVLTQFKAGKTNWNDQHFEAAEEILRDLRSMNIVNSENQILNWERLQTAGVHKCAEIIFNAFGDAFKDNKQKANEEYQKALKIDIYDLDTNQNARLDLQERFVRQGVFTR